MNGLKPIKLLVLIPCLLAAGLAVSSCVSSGTHEKMRAEKDTAIASLQQENATLGQQKTDLQQQTAELEQQKTELQQQTAALEQQKVDLEKQATALEKQKTFLQRLTISLDKDKRALEAADKQRQAQRDALVGQLSEEIQAGELKVRQYQNMLSVDVAEQLFFDSGHAKIKGGGMAVLKKVGEVLNGYDNKLIWVVGYTDNVPIGKALQGTFPTNWELSSARSTNVVRALQDVGVPPDRMVASGRGEYAPVAPNDTDEGRQQNRRIEIMLIDSTLVEAMLKPKE
jgi:chemotaxis protein MotB